MDWAFVGAIGAAFIGVAGILLSQLSSRQERRQESQQAAREREQTRREDFLFRSLDHFGGKTQERSVGIAIAEAYWKQVPELVNVLVPVLLNQLVYLLSVVDTADRANAAHERQNVRRIVALLGKIDDVDRFRAEYRSSLKAVDRKRKGLGIDLTPDEDIKEEVDAFLNRVAAGVGLALVSVGAAAPARTALEESTAPSRN